MSRSRIGLVSLVVLIALGLTWPAWRRSLTYGGLTPLIVYCAHDAVFSEQILRDFERRTGIPVEIRFDTEATKSLGLVNLIVQEAAHPRCDVFWNNQVLSTLELQQRGLLEPYRGPGFDRIPARWKDADGHWTGFAARFRVFIVNLGNSSSPIPVDVVTREMTQLNSSDGIDNLMVDMTHWAIANPMFGTTNTHYAVLWREWGGERLQTWHRELRRRGIIEVPGNGSVKNLVVAGICRAGFTDTDDVFAAMHDQKRVMSGPVRVNGRPICIPNSVAIVRGTRNLDAARNLVDFLLSEEVELSLANSSARQIPLGPVDESKLPPELTELRSWVKDSHDITDLLPAQEACLRWLKSESLRGE
jgi:iron(III) transport system substrate-binding protein